MFNFFTNPAENVNFMRELALTLLDQEYEESCNRRLAALLIGSWHSDDEQVRLVLLKEHRVMLGNAWDVGVMGEWIVSHTRTKHHAIAYINFVFKSRIYPSMLSEFMRTDTFRFVLYGSTNLLLIDAFDFSPMPKTFYMRKVG